MEKLRNHFTKILIPKGGDKVYKDECMFNFDTPESETGLYVCLNTFHGWSKEHVTKYSQKSGNCVFLHLRRNKKELPPEKEMEPEKKIARLAIGVEGGFNPDASKKRYEYEEHNSLVILPDFDIIPLPNPDLPEIAQQSVAGILKAESALHLAEVEAAAGAWDGEVRQVTKHADTLKQLDNGIKVPPNGWKCEHCDKTDNLWLNLTDGKILCGRRQLDGSGGNNHAVEHFEKTKYPLSVKLGTITQDGNADVYSYDEDDMVLDPNLVKHLAHFGINVKVMEKTEKTMLELEIDYNQRAWEWSRLTESGTKLVPKFGPGFAGMRNLGNSCYVNSVMQVLFTVPGFVERFYHLGQTIRESYRGSNPAEDFNVQMSKLAHGLLSGRYAVAPDTIDENLDTDDLQPGISPLMFRTLVGKGHAEFSTKKQQDSMEFLEHIIKMTACNSAGAADPGSCFKFEVEDKFVCSASGKVRYVTRPDQYLPLPVPMEEAVNKEEVAAYQAQKTDAQASQKVIQPEEQVRAKIPFDVCLSKLASPEQIVAYSSAAEKEVAMQKITRLRTFPDYLVIQLVKFGIGQDWVPMKYDVSIDMPESLDLSVLRGFGLQPGEEELPETAAPSPKEPEIDAEIVQQLAEMGFPWEACRKAVHLTGNSGTEAAMNWVMEHMGDPDFADPLVIKNTSSRNDNFTPNEEGLAMLMSMGFTREQAALALKETSNSLERAADWIFSHQHELDSLLAAQSGAAAVPPPQKPSYTDGPSKYELTAFISHMGTSIFVGHYVCHIKKDGEWTIFNDNKVSKSVDPPLDLGYIYLYKRVST
ncbi:ubiquitin carboxyl-terminal hydrolase 5-like isoform X2 [Homarus americanus]|uniref:ubiquitin carboxyl-terminal hydrolase 5-like isoform X2 n=1 Tax=Homarus americanus TaxID=6706 RepID=UPI001C4504BC|nr:ubiquitin carboxyl-terminal hydrolase 5-like isoform X2 [Homarus americanus]